MAGRGASAEVRIGATAAITLYLKVVSLVKIFSSARLADRFVGMRDADARATLVALDQVRTRTRRRVEAVGVPVSLAGAGCLVVGLVSLALPGAFAFGMALMCLSVAIASWAFARARGGRVGLRRPGWPYQVTGLVFSVGCFVLSAVITTRPPDAGPWLLVAAGYVAFVWLTRSWGMFIAGLAFAAVALMALAALPDLPLGATTATEGTVAIIAGLSMRRRGRE
jgi:hypothetical protein